MEVKVRVLNQDGSPVLGASIEIWSPSGYSLGSTDANGVVAVKVSEHTVTHINLNKKEVIIFQTESCIHYPDLHEAGMDMVVVLD